MYENYPVGTQAQGSLAGYAEKEAVMRRMNSTLRQNLDEQIVMAEKRVDELKAIKARMEASGIVDMRIDDLQQAMRW